MKTNQAYIGRKYFRSANASRSWRRYYGSSKHLTADIKALGKEWFKREIISLHRTRGRVNYCEIEEQFARKVLTAKLPDGSPAYYNRSIMGKWFVSP